MERLTAYEECRLLEQVSRGDDGAFRRIYDLYHPKVYGLAFFLTRSAVPAEDMTQEIFVKLWMHREELPSVQHFERWLKTLVRNHAYNYLNRMAREKRMLTSQYLTVSSQACFTEEMLTEKEFNAVLRQAIDNLPPQQKKVYILSRQDGLKPDTIAQTLGISIHTVKNHLKAALAAIRLSLSTHIALWLSFLLLFSA